VDIDWTNIPQKLKEFSKRVKNESGPHRETVRTLLSWFKAQRRGSLTCARIRSALKKVGLEAPDFERSYLDVEISFTAIAPDISLDHMTVGDAYADELITVDNADFVPQIGMLEAANREPLSVKRDDLIEKAITYMLLHDYSQLPVMQSNRDVKGYISWKTIGHSRIAEGIKPEKVQDCMEKDVEVLRYDTPLFDATEKILKKEFILVKRNDDVILGPVTLHDISTQFRDLSESFLSIGTIENCLRQLLSGIFTRAELKECIDPSNNEREVIDLINLSFGEYIRLIENPKRWEKLQVNLDRTVIVKRLHEVRDIRNNVMHFRPDGTAPEELILLKDTAAFLKQALSEKAKSELVTVS
jgi:predicted transcriptional regulator